MDLDGPNGFFLTETRQKKKKKKKTFEPITQILDI